MLILEEPFVSPHMIDWAEETKHPILDNAMARQIASSGRELNLVDDEEARELVMGGQRLLTNSENALDWVLSNIDDDDLARVLDTYKDKKRMREVLAPMYPELDVVSYHEDDLYDLDPEALSYPFVLKPEVGFCSVGVFTIQDESDWKDALSLIRKNREDWNARYPDSVLDMGEYVLEPYIDGVEYAIDAYFDEHGKSHVLNVLRHDFAGPEDTSDRLYVTSQSIIQEKGKQFEEWLDETNALIGARSMAVHPEIRLTEDGRIVPIEFNPMRFAGLGGTDVAYLGFGMRTYEEFLQDKKTDLKSLLEGKDGLAWSMSVLNAPKDMPKGSKFDYDAFERRFEHVLELSRFDADKTGNFGMLFLETSEDDPKDLDFVLRSDLREFISEP